MAKVNYGDMLFDLYQRADVNVEDVYKALGFSNKSSFTGLYQRHRESGKPIPPRIVEALVPLWRGRGQPPITADEIIALMGVSPIVQQAGASLVRPDVQGLPIRYRVDAGVFTERSLVGPDVRSGILPTPVFEPSAQFAVIVGSNSHVKPGTVLHCVKPEFFGTKVGRLCVVEVSRDGGALVGYCLKMGDDLRADDKVVAVVDARYIPER